MNESHRNWPGSLLNQVWMEWQTYDSILWQVTLIHVRSGSVRGMRWRRWRWLLKIDVLLVEGALERRPVRRVLREGWTTLIQLECTVETARLGRQLTRACVKQNSRRRRNCRHTSVLGRLRAGILLQLLIEQRRGERKWLNYRTYLFSVTSYK